MGNGITNNKTEALANSGDIYAKNYFFNNGDARLVANVTDIDTSQMLANVNRLRVVEHAPSKNYCRHQNRDAGECAMDRTVGLLAQEVSEVIPAAVGSGTSLTLRDATKLYDINKEKEGGRNSTLALPVLEEIKDVQSLDVHALLAQQIGAIQALSAQVQGLLERDRAHSAEIARLKAMLRQRVH